MFLGWKGGLVAAVAEWQIWGRVLGLPLLIGDTDGDVTLILQQFTAFSNKYPRLSLAGAALVRVAQAGSVVAASAEERMGGATAARRGAS